MNLEEKGNKTVLHDLFKIYEKDHKRTNLASNSLKRLNILVSLLLSYLNIASVSFNQSFKWFHMCALSLSAS